MCLPFYQVILYSMSWRLLIFNKKQIHRILFLCIHFFSYFLKMSPSVSHIFLTAIWSPQFSIGQINYEQGTLKYNLQLFIICVQHGIININMLNNSFYKMQKRYILKWICSITVRITLDKLYSTFKGHGMISWSDLLQNTYHRK